MLNERTVEGEVMRRTRSVVMDTSRGRTMEICGALAREGVEGLTLGSLEVEVHAAEEGRVNKLVKFLRQIGAVESYTKLSRAGIRSVRKYRLTQQVRELYGRVMSDE